ncbi:MAG: cytochrome c biogenesis protein CcsA [Planctomycetota bacterium]|nr:cytochrome c biogenesis protein CcsA [Planctomycetota bacterium]
MSTFIRQFCALIALVLVSAGLNARPQASEHRTQPWSERTLEAFGEIPIQDGGRIKPLSTYASFALLRLNGKRSAESSTGEVLDPVAWLLDVTFFPEDAALSKSFLVSDSDAIIAIGLSTDGKKKRDRWTYAELLPGMPRLFSLAHDYDAIEAKARTSIQQQVVDLASNVFSFMRLARSFDWSRGGDPSDGHALTVIAPANTTNVDQPWFAPANLVAGIGPNRSLEPADAAVVAEFETLIRLRADAGAFESTLISLRDRLVARAMARGEYEHVELERAYYAFDPIRWSLASFIAAFLGVSIMWLRPRSKLAWKSTLALTSVGALLLVTAIVLRCIIRERPPVSTLYETVLFVTASCVLVAVFIECVQRSRFAIQTAAVLGTVGLFVANGYETLDKQDTMPSLVAVLDTNFWLATHVTAITIGYSAGMLAAALASFYLLGKLIGWKRDEPETRRKLARTVYGVVCFALIFSTVGTILGGVWANDSWGRFWGWDPKENGALLIVISQIVMLHARRGGYLRDDGLCMAAAFGGTIVAFSWWGVNLLGVGLHSYGFTSGIHSALWTYYGIQWGVVGLGGVAWLRERATRKNVPVETPVLEHRRAKKMRAAA